MSSFRSKQARKEKSPKLLFVVFGCFSAMSIGMLLVQVFAGKDPAPAKGFRKVALTELGAFQIVEEAALPGALKPAQSWPTPTPTTYPDPIRALDGAEVVIPGYMMPYDEDGSGGVLSFYLVRSIMICCFGARPRLNEIVRCDAPPGHPVKYFYNVPVRVYGKLQVRELREYGQVQALYRLNVENVERLKNPDNSMQPAPNFKTGPVLSP
jgi:hypothetical protein